MLKFFKVAKDEEYEEIVDDNEEYEFVKEEVWQIAIDILETKNEMYLVAPIAWIELDDIEILYENWVLTISGERNTPAIYEWNINLRNSECFWWKFIRNVILPENLDYDNIRASLENSILTISIPKLRFGNKSITIEQH